MDEKTEKVDSNTTPDKYAVDLQIEMSREAIARRSALPIAWL
jgi:hypothetical protein